ncbi:MAG: CoA-binding protein [Euryarchaeota archaeon]|nr:CoA-binding protein [Euryarchaeota archaeon]
MPEEFVPADSEIAALLRHAKSVAVVGLSDNPSRPSCDVAEYLQRAGYRIVPVNPMIQTWHGIPSYPDLSSARAAGVPFDFVDVFRRPEEVGPVVDEAIRLGAKAIWFQLGVVNEAAARKAKEAGLVVVMDRCSKIEHRRLVR